MRAAGRRPPRVGWNDLWTAYRDEPPKGYSTDDKYDWRDDETVEETGDETVDERIDERIDERDACRVDDENLTRGGAVPG